MYLAITLEHEQAADLGYLLHKHPDRLQRFSQSFGEAVVFYPEVSPGKCTAVLALEVDPVALVRKVGTKGFRSGDQYVNDRPYVASSFLSVAISDVLGTALGGRSSERQELADAALPFSVEVPVVACASGPELVERLFTPLSYDIKAQPVPLDPQMPDLGESRYVSLKLTGRQRLRDLLGHLYVLLPVLDNDKHYFVGDAEVEKLLQKGEGWLAGHPERELIVSRYLKHRRQLANEALAQLIAEEPSLVEKDSQGDATEKALEATVPVDGKAPKESLHDRRLGTVLATLRAEGARRVLDLGCGEGKLLRSLLEDSQFTEIVGVEVSHRLLEGAEKRLKLDRMPEMKRQRLKLLHGSVLYRDDRLAGYDAAAVVEVIEHLEPSRLRAFERTVFEFARPTTVVITTPNSEYNIRFETLEAGNFRHGDHRFEWTRTEFKEWAKRTATAYGYAVRFLPVGDEDPEVGAPSQMAVFTLGQEEAV